MSGNANKRDSFTELDDGLEGVDDFTDEPNPFDDVIPDDYDTKTKPPMYGSASDSATLPPGYEEAVGTQQPPPPPTSAAAPANAALPPGLLNYLSQYFQLDDQQLKKNLYNSIAFKPNPQSDLENRGPDASQPDLYGAVWIFATIVATNFIGSQLFNVILNGLVRGVYWQNDSDKKFGGTRLIHSFWLYSTYAFLVPLIVAKTYLHRKDSIAELISAFGYSLIVWIPAGLLIDLCNQFRPWAPALALSLAKWALVALAFAKSSHSLHTKLDSDNGADQLVKWPVIGLNAITCVVARFLLYHS